MQSPFLVAVVLATAMCGTAATQTVGWTQLSPAAHPVGRAEHAMAYDAVRQRVVLFAGSNGSLLGDTWEWDGTNWLARFSLTYPSARSAHAMVYDAARQRVVLFGGSGSVLLNDTWEWDGTNWAPKTPAASPEARYNHAMAYDATRQRVVLFGGYGSYWLNDTWEWDGTNWLQQPLLPGPTPRHSHAMAYDSLRQRVVLAHGVTATNMALGDTWEWDGIAWVERTSGASPPGRYAHAMTYNEARQRVLLFGGSFSGGGTHGDTWEWDGTNWAQQAPAMSPSARGTTTMAYDNARQQTVLFGGDPGARNDTWVHGVPIIAATATAYGVGCGSPALVFLPDGTGRPVLGQTGSAFVLHAPTPFGGVAIGWGNQFSGPFPLPVDLGGIGMPGCNLWQSAETIGLDVASVTPGTMSFSAYIPNDLYLLGLHVYIQAYAVAPGFNALQTVSSNAIDWRLGNI